MNENKKNNFQGFRGFLGFIGFLGMQAFTYHNPWYLFWFCFSGYFFEFRVAPGILSNLKYLGLLSIAGLIVAILGVFGIIQV